MVKAKKNWYSRTAFFATLLAFTVVILGAYTRLKDAGLGCPDWPGCYGQIIVPQSTQAIQSAQKLFPLTPVDTTKAWAEMIHRYFAACLGLLILALAIWHFRQRKQITSHSKIPFLLIGCVMFQGMLGKWTVTWQLLPLVVMGHLLGGMTITALLWWLTLDAGHRIMPSPPALHYLKPFIILGLIIVFLQIFLGGWTSANYASIVCPDFPYCRGALLPKFDFAHAFNFFSPIGKNYQGGILGDTARVTIQMVHRYGAFITLAYVSTLNFIILFSKKTGNIKNTAGMILLILGTQVFLGILNVATLLYLPIAVTHNAVALALLMAMTTLLYQVGDKENQAYANLAQANISSEESLCQN